VSVSKSDIIDEVAEDSGVSKLMATTIINKAFEKITSALQSVGEVDIHGFGKFTVKEVAARQGRNPATGESIEIAASQKVSFKPSSVLKKAVK